jgi:transposase
LRGLRPRPPHGASEPHLTIPLLFLITVFQHLENLSDSQAAAAMLHRLDWKYALHLPLISQGFDQNELGEYHRKVLADPTILHPLNGLLERVQDLYDSHPKDRKKVDAVVMLDAVRAINRCSEMLTAMRLALDELAICHPDWLKRTVLPHWFHRYARSGTGRKAPETPQKREALALAVGLDGFSLLDALAMDGAPPEAANLSEVEYLRHVWGRHIERTNGQIHWRMAPVLAGVDMESGRDDPVPQRRRVP